MHDEAKTYRDELVRDTEKTSGCGDESTGLSLPTASEARSGSESVDDKVAPLRST
jgi:hypothetical protein